MTVDYSKNTLRNRAASSRFNRARADVAKAPWTQAEMDLLRRLHFEEGLGAEDISHRREFRIRTAGAIRAKLCTLRTERDCIDRKDVPQQALIDRDARARASSLKSIVGSLMGDPPPGFSALERRRG